MLPMLLRLAFRNLTRQRGRTAFTLLAIASGVACTVLMGGFVDDILGQLREATIRSQLGHIQVTSKEFRRRPSAQSTEHHLRDPEALRARIKAQRDVEIVLARLQIQGLANNGRADLPFVGEGVEPEGEARLGVQLTILAGSNLAAGARDQALLGEGLAAGLGVAPGDTITLLVNAAGGSLNSLEFRVAGVFRTFSKDYDDRAVRIPLPAAQELLVTPAVDTLVVGLRETDLTERAAAALRDSLGGDLELVTWDRLAEFHRQAVDLYERQFLVLQLIVGVMTLLAVANSVSMTLHERASEIGTMRALGNRQNWVLKTIMAETTALALVGATLGVVLGSLLAVIISAIGIPMPPPPNANAEFVAGINIVPGVVLKAFLLGSIATIAAAIVPARRSLRVPVTEALARGH